ncbi:uncharacterized protein [Eschrichtius robustus]|uniref:uncharacterized protein n=1 Tax=Eschrichtius robustus TaxID=9764 RepID=UPI0035C09363
MRNTSQVFRVWSKQNVLTPAKLVEARVPLGRQGGANDLAGRARHARVASRRHTTRHGPPWAARGGRRRDLESSARGRVAPDALPPCVFRLKGDPDLIHNNNKTGALAAGAPILVPALLPPVAASAAPGLAPQLPCRRRQAESPSANFSRCRRAASRDPGPDRGRRRAVGRERPPRRTLGRTVRSVAVPGGGGRRWRAPQPSLRPEPGGARTWRGKLHPRPGPQTPPPPPPLSIILGTGNGLCIARCTCD